MDSPAIAQVKSDVIPRIFEVMLGNHLQLDQIGLAHQLFDLLLCFVWVVDRVFVSIAGGTMANVADMFDIFGPGFVLATKHVTFLCVTFDDGGEELVMDVWVDLPLVLGAPKKACLLELQVA